MNTEINLPKNYAPKEFEDRIYKKWCDRGYFTAKRDPEKKPYTIVIPIPTSPASSTWDTRWTTPSRISSSATSA